MNKTEFMNALNVALEGLPGVIIEDTMWEYEKKFTDAKAAGQSEEDIAKSFKRPELIAAQLKAARKFREVKRNVSVQNVASLMMSLLGIAVFNLFMLVPTVIYFSLLLSGYVCALAFYGIGIVMLAGGLSGVEQFTFKPQTIFLGSATNQNFTQDQHVFMVLNKEGIHGDDHTQVENPGSDTTVTVSTDLSTKDNAWKGFGILCGGIALFMLCLVATKYTFVAFSNYIRWQISLLSAPFSTVPS